MKGRAACTRTKVQGVRIRQGGVGRGAQWKGLAGGGARPVVGGARRIESGQRHGGRIGR